MKTKAVYVLISQETDYHLERLLLSVYSLRVHNPDMGIVIVTDPETKDRLAYADLPNNVELVAVMIPDKYQQMQKSRYLKTQLRSFVTGDFLYLDTDTLICGKLDGVNSFQGEVAMIPDCNGDLPLSSLTALELCEKAGFHNLKGAPYFNGGVMFVSDSLASRRLFERWYNRWLESVENGVSFDQPALCQANVDCGLLIKELPGTYNWQIIKGRIPDWKKGRIIHYYNCRIGRRVIPEHIRNTGLDDKIQKVTSSSPDQIFTLFTMSDLSICEYLMSDMLCVFHNYPNFYSSVVRFTKALLKPYIGFSSIKSRFHKRNRCCTT